MLYNTYRPQKFSEVVGQTEVIENLASQSKRDKFFGVYILCGQFGSGKTTTARIIAMAANCQHKDGNGNPCGECEACRSIKEGTAVDVQEIAAAVSTGVDKVREICETVSYVPAVLQKKVYIIDEVQALSKNAFQAFLKMLEEPPAHAIFVLATTDVGAIPPTVRSRAATYYFRQLTQSEIAEHCHKVAGTEGLSVTRDACEIIAKYSQGSMRNALSLLDMATQDGMTADGDKVEKLLGVSTPDAVFRIIRDVLAGNAGEVVMDVTALAEGGSDLSVLVTDLLNTVSDLAVASVSPDSVKGTEHYLSLIRETVVLGSSTRFTAFADELYRTKQVISKSPELPVLTVSLVRLARRTDVVLYADSPTEEVTMLRAVVSALEVRVRELEARISGVETTEVPVVSVTESMTESLPEKAAYTREESECTRETPEGHMPADPEVTEAIIDIFFKKKEDNSQESICEASGSSATPEDEEADEEDALFAFLGLGDEQKKGKLKLPWENLHRLETDLMFRAVMSCCQICEDGDVIKITSEFPVAEKFLRTCIPAYGRKGYDVSGIRIG